jgi:hypothetical protein
MRLEFCDSSPQSCMSNLHSLCRSDSSRKGGNFAGGFRRVNSGSTSLVRRFSCLGRLRRHHRIDVINANGVMVSQNMRPPLSSPPTLTVQCKGALFPRRMPAVHVLHGTLFSTLACEWRSERLLVDSAIYQSEFHFAILNSRFENFAPDIATTSRLWR